MHLGHVGGLEIGDVVLTTDTLSCGGVGSSDETVTGRALTETGQGVEDGAMTVVQQENTEIASQVLIPQGVLVVEEAEVTNDAKNLLVSDQREAGSCGEGALDAIDATIAIDRGMGVGVGQADGSGVGVVDYIVH